MAINRDQWLGNRQKVALDESKQPQTQKHGFLHCSSMAKTIDRTQKSPTQKTNNPTIMHWRVICILGQAAR